MWPALFAAVAVLAAWECGDHRLLRRLGDAPVGETVRGRGGQARLLVLVVGVGCVVLGGALDGRRGVTLGVVAAIAGWTAWTLGRRSRSRRRAAQARSDVARAGEALSGLLGVGAIPAAALASVAGEHPVLAEAAAEQEIGGEVVGVLRRGASGPGREGLAELAAAWEVASRTGASMESSLDAIAEELRRRQEVATTVAVELAASRSAGRLLAALPLAGVLLGYGFGGDPLAFLTGNPVGEICLVLAAGLASGGLIWTDTLAERSAR